MPAAERCEDALRHMRLRDGRVLAWAEHGVRDGTPIFYCHGFPACRLEAQLVAEDARRTGVRLIAPDRPGFGGSDPAPGRRLDDWPRDLEQLLDGLGIADCRLLGMSGGGPYALACGAVLPDRVGAIALMGALGPLAEVGASHGMSRLARVSLYLARERPRFQASVFRALAQVVRYAPSALLQVSEQGPDREVLARSHVRRVLLETMRGSVRQGAGAAIEELRLYAADWPFALGDVAAPVWLYHGEADAVVPPAHGRAIAATLPQVQTRFVAAEGHFSLPAHHAEAILGELRGADAARSGAGA